MNSRKAKFEPPRDILRQVKDLTGLSDDDEVVTFALQELLHRDRQAKALQSMLDNDWANERHDSTPMGHAHQ